MPLALVRPTSREDVPGMKIKCWDPVCGRRAILRMNQHGSARVVCGGILEWVKIKYRSWRKGCMQWELVWLLGGPWTSVIRVSFRIMVYLHQALLSGADVHAER